MKIRENLVLRRIGSENIVIAPDKDTVNLTNVYTLNETMVLIWEHFKNEDFTIDSIVDFLTNKFDVGRERATKDVESFVDVLIAGELIVDN